jgi:hypothetical protein
VGRVTVKVRSQAILAWPHAGLEQSGLEALTTQAHTLAFATELSSFVVAPAPWLLAPRNPTCGVCVGLRRGKGCALTMVLGARLTRPTMSQQGNCYSEIA